MNTALGIRGSRRGRNGFTIVELLIVIVIIGVLATIVVVSYSGITNKAHDASLQSDVDNASTLLDVYRAENHKYPQDSRDANGGDELPASGNNTISYVVSTDGKRYCVAASRDGVSYRKSNNTTDKIERGDCSDVSLLQAMQAFSASDCDRLEVYNGSAVNPSALVTLRDSRGDGQNYTVGRLADGNCWMLDNLRLGSASGTIELSSSDTDLATGQVFNLPQLVSAYSDYDDFSAIAYNEVDGDTGSGSTNYGYFYNWPAATAGKTQYTQPAGSPNVQYSICPLGWRLPSAYKNVLVEGEFYGGEYYDLDVAFGGDGDYQSEGPSITHWSYNGAFRGVLAGRWGSSFGIQNSAGYLWSSSSRYYDATYAFDLYFDRTDVYPYGNTFPRSYGFAVRCIFG